MGAIHLSTENSLPSDGLRGTTSPESGSPKGVQAQERDGAGRAFTHHVKDVVTTSTPQLGALINRVNHTDRNPPWTFGVGKLVERVLARRIK